MPVLPRSLWWFVITGVIFLLQLFPWTGIFLMFLMAPFWSVVTINLGFAGIAFEASRGRVSPLWLAAPAIWFGGYAIATVQSSRSVATLDAEIRQANASQTLAFDPRSAALVIRENANDIGDLPTSLVTNYNVPVTYRAAHPARTSRNDLQKIPETRAHRLADADTCARARSDQRVKSAQIHVTHQVRGAAAGICQIRIPEEPTLPQYVIEARSEPIRGWLVEGKTVHVSIAPPGGRPVRLRTGHAAPLAMFPMPIMGCFLNSSAPRWQCQAGFAKQTFRGLGGAGAYGRAANEIIAQALRLSPRSTTQMIDDAEATAAAVDAAVHRHENTALSNLDRILADPTIRATVHDLWGLHERPQELVSRSGRMLEAMSAALAHGNGNSETARNLQRLLATLPDADFRLIGIDLLRRLEDGRPRVEPRRSREPDEQIDGFLAPRLGDLGAPALPILTRLAFSNRVDPQAILGLCRIGAPAAHLAERLTEHAIARMPASSEARAAAYVTLVRWGRSDLAESLITSDRNDRQRRNYASRWPGLTEGAGAQVCKLRYRA